MRAPRCCCRAFGSKEAAAWISPKVDIDLEVTFGLCNQMTVSQRLLSSELSRRMSTIGQEQT